VPKQHEGGIYWTDETWNPIRGCSRVSEGCRNCYAEKVAYRFSGPGQPYEGLVQTQYKGDELVRLPKWNGMILFAEDHLLDPLRWRPVVDHEPTCDYYLADRKQIRNCGCPARPRRIFVNSMSDLFHENVTDEMRDKIFAVMALCPQHTFQVLTKRPARMLTYLIAAAGRLADVIESMRFDEPRRAVGPLPHLNGGDTWFPLANVHIGVSVEDQKAADERIPLLLQAPAAVRFISAEPLLGALDIRPYLFADPERPNWARLNRLHWVIVGGESGPGARPMHPDWARSLRDQCVAADVPYFFKQWGEWSEVDGPHCRSIRPELAATASVLNADGSLEGRKPKHSPYRDSLVAHVGKKAAGRLLDGREWNEMPEVRA
jgi:protein gp37